MDTVLLIILAFAYITGVTVLAGWLADRKGYSFLLFAILGLFLGVLAVLVAAIIPKKKTAPAEA
jgi:MFS family permease